MQGLFFAFKNKNLQKSIFFLFVCVVAWTKLNHFQEKIKANQNLTDPIFCFTSFLTGILSPGPLRMHLSRRKANHLETRLRFSSPPCLESNCTKNIYLVHTGPAWYLACPSHSSVCLSSLESQSSEVFENDVITIFYAVPEIRNGIILL